VVIAEPEQGLALVRKTGRKRIAFRGHRLHDRTDRFFQIDLQAGPLLSDLRQVICRTGFQHMKDLARLRGRRAIELVLDGCIDIAAERCGLDLLIDRK